MDSDGTMNTPEKLNKDHNRIATVKVKFIQPDMDGWIYLFVSIGYKTLEIHLTNVFNPFGDIFAFLTNVLTNKLPALCYIDEEGKEVNISAESENDELILLTVKSDRSGSFSFKVNKKQFVRNFIDEFEYFLEHDYDNEGWAALGAFEPVRYDNALDLRKTDTSKIKALL